MYGKLNQRKIHENDYIMSCQKAREQLASYINQQAKRTNIDSAKKRAVVQHMDYEGFRQMVLGANIFPTKSKQLYTFTKGQQIPILPIKNQQQPENDNISKNQKSNKQSAILLQVQGKSEMHCNSFREFKKKFNNNYQKQFDKDKTLYCYNLLKQQNQGRIKNIFNTQCEGNILLKITNIFNQVITQMTTNKSQIIQRQAQFMLIFFKTLLNISTMKSITLAILTKKQKQTIADFVFQLKNVFKQEEDIVEAQRISNLIQK